MFDVITDIIGNSPYNTFMFYLGILCFIFSALFYLRLILGMNNFKNRLKEIQLDESTNAESRIFIINKWFQEKNSFLFPKVLKVSWDRFYGEYSSTKDKYIPDVFESFKEDQIVYKSGNRKLIELIPAIFVSLGLLGTFWGITTGISDINTNGSVENIQLSINTLLNGMQFAFYSSIVGIVISLAFQLFDRIILYKRLLNSYDNLILVLDEVFPIKTEGSLLEELLETQQEQMNDMKTFFADEFISKLTSGISDTIAHSLNPHLEKSNQIMEQVAKNTTEAQSEKLNEMVDYFVQSLNEITGDHMRDLGNALTKTVEWQEKVHAEMSSLVEELSNVAEKQAEMARNTTELSEQMNEYTETLSEYQGKLVSSTQELNSITEQNTRLLEQMRAMSEEMNGRHQEAEDSFSKKLTQMNETVVRITELGAIMNELQEETNTSIGSLNNATDSINQSIANNTRLNESLVSQHELSNQWSVKTQSLLEDLVQNLEINESMQSQMQDLFEKLTNERQMVDSMKEEHTNLLENSIKDLKSFWGANREALTGNKEQFESLNEMLSQSMGDFAEHMHRGVQRTFEQFDKQLKQAIEYLERGVGGIQQVVESMEQDIESVNGQISKFNQSLEQIAAGVKQ